MSSSRAPRSWWDFLIAQDFRVLESYGLLGGFSSPAGFFFGARCGALPEKFWHPIEFNADRFRVLLQRGLNPLVDWMFTEELFERPLERRYVWQIIANEEYPQRAHAAAYFPFAFASSFNVGAASAEALALVIESGEQLGANLAIESGGPSNLSPLFYVRFPDTARYLVEVAKADPKFVSGRDKQTAGEYQLQQLATRWDSRVGSWERRRELGERLRRERLATLQTEIDVELALVEGERYRTHLMNMLRTIDYLLHGN